MLIQFLRETIFCCSISMLGLSWVNQIYLFTVHQFIHNKGFIEGMHLSASSELVVRLKSRTTVFILINHSMSVHFLVQLLTLILFSLQRFTDILSSKCLNSPLTDRVKNLILLLPRLNESLPAIHMVQPCDDLLLKLFG